MNKYLMAASDISMEDPQSNEIYFSVTMRMLTTEVNLNGVRLTDGFINDIAEHAEKYVCMPLCADVERLSRGLDVGLTHMYDEQGLQFKAPQIGSFFEVHRVEDEHGLSLVGTARINKRNADVTDKIIQMYNAGRLKFSFEIWASEIYEEDGITVVDAAPGNQLTAMAIVTTPALPAAVAIGLAAELDVNAFTGKIWELLDRKFHDNHWEVIWMGLDYAVVRFGDSGKMLRVNYKQEDGELVETDEYEVGFARIEEVKKEMDNIVTATTTDLSGTITLGSGTATASTMTVHYPTVTVAEVTNVETPAVEEVTEVVEEVANMNTVVEEAAVEAAAEAEDEKPCAGCDIEQLVEAEAEPEANAEGDDAGASENTDELRRELEQAKAELAQYKEAEAKAKLAEKQNAIRKYAEHEHLDMNAENVKAAIENVDYEALAAEVMAKNIEVKNEETYRVTAEMKISPFGNMFEKAN